MLRILVSVVQMCVHDTCVSANKSAILRAIERAAADGADILLTPEGSLSGYHNRFDPEEVRDALAEVAARAKEAKLGLALGTCYFESDGKCYNQVRLYDKSGAYLGFHSKILRCGPPKPRFDAEIPYYAEIDSFETTPLRVFDFHGICLGMLICNDLWANPQYTPMDDPHLLQKLSAMGAEIVLHAVNGYRDETDYSQVLSKNYHEANLRLRAMAAEVHLVTVDNAYPAHIPTSSPSGAIAPNGDWLSRLPDRAEHQQTWEIALN